jgi:hypothetical protein
MQGEYFSLLVKNLLKNEIFSLPFSLRSFTRCHSGISVPRRSQGSSGLGYLSFADNLDWADGEAEQHRFIQDAAGGDFSSRKPIEIAWAA